MGELLPCCLLCGLFYYVKLLAAENDVRTHIDSHVTWPCGTEIYGKGADLFL